MFHKYVVVHFYIHHTLHNLPKGQCKIIYFHYSRNARIALKKNGKIIITLNSM